MKGFLQAIWNLGKKIILLAVIGYAIFIVSRTVWQNYIINQRISNLENEIEYIAQEKNHLKNEIVYYGTNSYREIEARRKLGLKKSGETIVPLPAIKGEDQERDGKDRNDQNDQEENEPNYIKWWKLIIGG